MKKMLAALSLGLLLMTGCKKNDNGGGLYDTVITGVSLRTMDAAPAGTMGTPNTQTNGQNFSVVAYPIPSAYVQNFYIKTTTTGLSANCKLVSAIFPGVSGTIAVENENMQGVIVRQMQTGPLNGNNHFAMDVSDLPQGFYRLYFEVSNGELYWENVWITR